LKHTTKQIYVYMQLQYHEHLTARTHLLIHKGEQTAAQLLRSGGAFLYPNDGPASNGQQQC